MPFDFVQSPAGLEALLLFLLFLWLGGSVAMTIITGYAERRQEQALARRAGYARQPSFSGQINAAPDMMHQ